MRFRALALCAVSLIVCGCAETPSGGPKTAIAPPPPPPPPPVIALAHCTHPLGKAALVEPDDKAKALLNGIGLPSPTTFLRLVTGQSNCLHTGKGEAGDYLLKTNVAVSPAGAGASPKISDARATLLLVNARTGAPVTAAEGMVRASDFAGGAGLTAVGADVTNLTSTGPYSNTPEGRLVAAALLNAYSKLAAQMQALPPPAHPAAHGPGKELIADIQSELTRLGYYSGAPDGQMGAKTKAAIEDYQKSKNMTPNGKASQSLLDSLKSN